MFTVKLKITLALKWMSSIKYSMMLVHEFYVLTSHNCIDIENT